MNGDLPYSRRSLLECVEQPNGYPELTVGGIYRVTDPPKETGRMSSSYLLTMIGDPHFSAEIPRDFVESPDFFTRVGL